MEASDRVSHGPCHFLRGLTERCLPRLNLFTPCSVGVHLGSVLVSYNDHNSTYSNRTTRLEERLLDDRIQGG